MTEHLKRSLWLEIDLDRLKGNFSALKEMAMGLCSADRSWKSAEPTTWA